MVLISRKEKQSYIAANLQFLRGQKHLTLQEMAELLDLKGKSSYRAYEEGRALPDIHKMMRLASFFNVSLDELVYKDISILKPSKKGKNVVYYEVELIPVSIAAGYAKEFGDAEFISELKKVKIPDKPFGITRAFEISGDSMEPEIKNHSIVLARKIGNGEVCDNKIYIVVTANGPQCKTVRFNSKKDETIYLISKNEKYPPQIINKRDILEMWAYWKTLPT